MGIFIIAILLMLMGTMYILGNHGRPFLAWSLVMVVTGALIGFFYF